MAKIFEQLGNLYTAFLDTKPGKAFSIITSSAVSRIFTLASVILPLAGVTIVGLAVPIVPALAIPLSVVAIVGVVAGVIIDTARTRNTRKLLRENKSLMRLNGAIARQDVLLEQYPKLSSVLQDHLINPAKDTTKIKSFNTQKYKIPKALTKTAVHQAAYIPLSIVHSLSSPLYLVVNSIKALVSFGMETKIRLSLSDAKNLIKHQINEERVKAPSYSNIRELRIMEKEQRIQRLALEQLISTEPIDKMSNAQITERFEHIKHEINIRAKNISKSNGVVRVIQDFGRAHNPLSRYNDTGKIKKAMSKEKIWEKEGLNKLSYEENIMQLGQESGLLKKDSNGYKAGSVSYVKKLLGSPKKVAGSRGAHK
jgi:hypothetical protein